jgi:hypothetical protein
MNMREFMFILLVQNGLACVFVVVEIWWSMLVMV